MPRTSCSAIRIERSSGIRNGTFRLKRASVPPNFPPALQPKPPEALQTLKSPPTPLPHSLRGRNARSSNPTTMHASLTQPRHSDPRAIIGGSTKCMTYGMATLAGAGRVALGAARPVRRAGPQPHLLARTARHPRHRVATLPLLAPGAFRHASRSPLARETTVGKRAPHPNAALPPGGGRVSGRASALLGCRAQPARVVRLTRAAVDILRPRGTRNHEPCLHCLSKEPHCKVTFLARLSTPHCLLPLVPSSSVLRRTSYISGGGLGRCNDDNST